MPLREPVVAGQFYPGTKTSLEKALSALIDKKAKKQNSIAAVSPHAGYVYSGAVAGKVFSMISPKDLFIIIGPNHTGAGNPFGVYAKGSWKTPLGTVDIDEEFAEALINGSALFRADEKAHAYEHSIEVQVPFLQYAMGGFKILPLCVASAEISELKEAAADLVRSIKALKRESTIIASSDMTHYEPHDTAKAKDMKAISAMLDMDEDRLWQTVHSINISMCGVSPVVMTLNAAKAIGAKKAELVDYKTSGDASGDYYSVVGYAGLIIK